jgi:uncharacterized protein YjbJ (UPF0337 family)
LQRGLSSRALEDSNMNTDVLKGKWRQLKGEVQIQWGKLTNDDLDMVEGDFDKLVGRIQERYGYERERARRELNEWIDRQPVMP